MRPGFIKALTAAACAVAAVYYIGRPALGHILSLPVRCGQPCPADKPDCAPIAIDFDLKEARIKSGKVPRMWSRVAVTNKTCGVVLLAVDFFASGETDRFYRGNAYGFQYEVADDAGRMLDPAPAYFAGRGRWIELGGGARQMNAPVLVISNPHSRDDDLERAVQYLKPNALGDAPIQWVRPYVIDPDGRRRLEEKSIDGFIRLAPGASISTVQTIYWPHQRRTFELELPGVGPGSASGNFPVQLKRRIAADPPAGYRLLDKLVFVRPGRYRLSVVYNGEIAVLNKYRYQSWPRPVRRVLLTLRELLKIELSREPRSGPRIVSNEQEVVVE